MRWLALLLLISPVVLHAAAPSALVLADESVRLENGSPVFTANQVANSSAATRDGLVLWAATAQAQSILQRLSPDEYVVFVSESASENESGHAMQPSIATLAAAHDHRKLKVYQVTVNPTVFDAKQFARTFVASRSAAQMMALAWAAEMLHVDFYARGISLPHHRRDDFQREWEEVTLQLGMYGVRHDDGDDPPRRVRPSARRFP